MKERIKWYFKQLLPLVYVSEYGEANTDKRFVTVWRMWFGHCFNIETWEVMGKANNTG